MHAAHLSPDLPEQRGDHSPTTNSRGIGFCPMTRRMQSLASVLLVARNAVYRRIHRLETVDEDGDGVPDAYQPRQD